MNTTVDPREKKTILVVDDTPENLSLMSDLLADDYNVRVANSGAKALRIADGTNLPDLVLLDIMMPDIDGYEVLRAFKASGRTKDIPVIFLTAKSEVSDEEMVLDMGAEDYIIKPISPPIMLARVRTHLKLKEAADFLRDKNEYLTQEVERRTQEVKAIQDVTILTMASLAETRDNETGNHIRRTQSYVRALANKLKGNPHFAALLCDGTIDMIVKSAPLHDIGKVGIPDNILLQPRRLTAEEFEIMKTHTTIGLQAIQHAESRLGTAVDFLKYAKEIAYSHQEKWDGSGYPEGIGGESIPIAARLMAVADVYDALISRRVYKLAMSHQEAVNIIAEGKGRHFDPDVVNAFLSIAEEIRAIAASYLDVEK